MTDPKLPGQTWAQRFTAALKKVKHARHYALTESSALAGGAMCAAYQDAKRWHVNFDEELNQFVAERLAKHVKPLVQQRGEAEEKLPEWPNDPVTGERLPNPWPHGSL